MKISIEVDEGSVGKSIEDVLKGLTPEQKTGVAKEVMLRWLETNFQEKERSARESAVVQEIQSKVSYYGSKNDSDIRNSWDFREAMKDWRSSGDLLVQTIAKDVIQDYKALVHDLIDKDPSFQAMREDVLKIIRESFPKMVHDAMVAWFAGHMGKMMEGVQQALAHLPQIDQFQQQVADRLNQIALSRR